MTKTKIIALCIFCFFVCGVITIGGYATWEDYRNDHVYAEIGHDMLDEVNEKTNRYTDLIKAGQTWLEGAISNPFSKFVQQLTEGYRETIQDLFDGIVDFFEEIYEFFNGKDFEYDGDGFGGGSGGAR